MKKISILLVCLLMMGIFVGCGETTTPEKVDNSVEVSKENENQNESTTEIFKIGDTVKMGELEITVNSVRWSKGDEFFKPEDGERWLVIDATIVNNSKESTSISSMLMFSLQDKEGYKKDMVITADEKGSLDGEIGAGRKLRGEIAYSVGADQNEWEFIFEPNVFGFGQAIYKITAADVK